MSLVAFHYLIIDHEMTLALTMAAKRGVDVRIVVPKIPDKKAVYTLTESYFRPLLEAGVRLYRYTPGFIHAKSYLADDKTWRRWDHQHGLPQPLPAL